MSMEKIVRNITEFLTVGPYNARSMSKMAGMNESYLRDILNGRIKNPRKVTLERLARVMTCPVEDLKEKDMTFDRPLYVRPVLEARPVAETGLPRREETLSVLELEKEKNVLQTFTAAAVLAMPPVLKGVPGAYGVKMPDSTMSPRFEADEILWVDPVRRLVPPADAVVTGKDGKTVIARVEKKTATLLEIRFYNPENRRKIKIKDIESVHVIVGRQIP
jgi:transcriptional regulator with XRE-family HTH domain